MKFFKHQKPTRVMAIMTAFLFLISSSTYAMPFSIIPPDNTPVQKVRIPGEIKIPAELGSVERSYRSPSNSSFVIYIQDAHALSDAQNKIRKLIDYFQNEYGISLVALEGGRGELDSTLLRSFPDVFAKKKTVMNYVELGELGGAAAAAILNPFQGTYHGIEDWPLYEKNYEAYLQASEKTSLILSELEKIENDLDGQSQKIFNPKRYELYRHTRSFYDETEDLPELLNYIQTLLPGMIKRECNPKYEKCSRIQNSIGVDTQAKIQFRSVFPNQYPHLAALFDSLIFDAEETQEPEVFIRKLSVDFRKKYFDRLDSESAIEFTQKHQAYVTGELSPGDFLKFLILSGERIGLHPKLTPKLQALIGRTDSLATIKGTVLFDELENLIERIDSRIPATDLEKEIAEKFKKLRILKNMARLEITRDQFEDYSRDAESFLALLGNARSSLFPALQFYDFALKRDKAFHENLSVLLEKKRASAAVVITGGFHAEGFEASLKEAGISYAVVVPKVDSLEGREFYTEVMHARTSYRDYLKTTFYDGFMRRTALELMKGMDADEFRKNLKLWRDDVIRKLANENRLGEAGKYTRYIDRLIKIYHDRFGDQRHEDVGAEEIISAVEKELDNAREQTVSGLWSRFQIQLDTLSRGLKVLIEEGNLDLTHIKNLLKTTEPVNPIALSGVQVLDPTISAGSIVTRFARGEKITAGFQSERLTLPAEFVDTDVLRQRLTASLSRDFVPLQNVQSAVNAARTIVQSEVDAVVNQTSALNETELQRGEPTADFVQRLQDVLIERVIQETGLPETQARRVVYMALTGDALSIPRTSVEQTAGFRSEMRSDKTIGNNLRRDNSRFEPGLPEFGTFEIPEKILNPGDLKDPEGLFIGAIYKDWNTKKDVKEVAGFRSQYQYSFDITTSTGRRIFISDHHNNAAYFWAKAFQEGVLQKGSRLLHIDAHADDAFSRRSIENPLDLTWSESAVQKLTHDYYGIESFIVPMVINGLIDPEQWFFQAGLEDYVLQEKFVWNPGTGNTAYPFSVNPYTTRRALSETFSDDLIDIVDFDVDIFAPVFRKLMRAYSKNLNEDEAFEAAQKDLLDNYVPMLTPFLARAKVLTIVTSPAFIDQDLALRIIARSLEELQNFDPSRQYPDFSEEYPYENPQEKFSGQAAENFDVIRQFVGKTNFAQADIESLKYYPDEVYPDHIDGISDMLQYLEEKTPHHVIMWKLENAWRQRGSMDALRILLGLYAGRDQLSADEQFVLVKFVAALSPEELAVISRDLKSELRMQRSEARADYLITSVTAQSLDPGPGRVPEGVSELQQQWRTLSFGFEQDGYKGAGFLEKTLDRGWVLHISWLDDSAEQDDHLDFQKEVLDQTAYLLQTNSRHLASAMPILDALTVFAPFRIELKDYSPYWKELIDLLPDHIRQAIRDQKIPQDRFDEKALESALRMILPKLSEDQKEFIREKGFDSEDAVLELTEKDEVVGWISNELNNILGTGDYTLDFLDDVTNGIKARLSGDFDYSTTRIRSVTVRPVAAPPMQVDASLYGFDTAYPRHLEVWVTMENEAGFMLKINSDYDILPFITLPYAEDGEDRTFEFDREHSGWLIDAIKTDSELNTIIVNEFYEFPRQWEAIRDVEDLPDDWYRALEEGFKQHPELRSSETRDLIPSFSVEERTEMRSENRGPAAEAVERAITVLQEGVPTVNDFIESHIQSLSGDETHSIMPAIYPRYQALFREVAEAGAGIPEFDALLTEINTKDFSQGVVMKYLARIFYDHGQLLVFGVRAVRYQNKSINDMPLLAIHPIQEELPVSFTFGNQNLKFLGIFIQDPVVEDFITSRGNGSGVLAYPHSGLSIDGITPIVMKKQAILDQLIFYYQIRREIAVSGNLPERLRSDNDVIDQTMIQVLQNIWPDEIFNSFINNPQAFADQYYQSYEVQILLHESFHLFLPVEPEEIPTYLIEIATFPQLMWIRFYDILRQGFTESGEGSIPHAQAREYILGDFLPSLFAEHSPGTVSENPDDIPEAMHRQAAVSVETGYPAALFLALPKINPEVLQRYAGKKLLEIVEMVHPGFDGTLPEASQPSELRSDTVRAENRTQSVDEVIRKINDLAKDADVPQALQLFDEVLGSVERKLNRGEINNARRLLWIAQTRITPQIQMWRQSELDRVQDQIAERKTEDPAISRKLQEEITIFDVPMTLHDIIRKLPIEIDSLQTGFYNELEPQDQAFVRSVVNAQGLKQLRLWNALHKNYWQALDAVNNQADEDIHRRTNPEELMRLQELIFEAGMKYGITAHGVELPKGGLLNLLKILLDGRMRQGGFGPLIYNNPQIFAGAHGPFYILVKPGAEDPQSIDQHAVYLVPEDVDRNVLVSVLQAINRENPNLIDKKTVSEIVAKIMTYQEFVNGLTAAENAKKPEMRAVLGVVPDADRILRSDWLPDAGQILADTGNAGVDTARTTIWTPQAEQKRTAFDRTLAGILQNAVINELQGIPNAEAVIAKLLDRDFFSVEALGRRLGTASQVLDVEGLLESVQTAALQRFLTGFAAEDVRLIDGLGVQPENMPAIKFLLDPANYEILAAAFKRQYGNDLNFKEVRQFAFDGMFADENSFSGLSDVMASFDRAGVFYLRGDETRNDVLAKLLRIPGVIPLSRRPGEGYSQLRGLRNNPFVVVEKGVPVEFSAGKDQGFRVSRNLLLQSELLGPEFLTAVLLAREIEEIQRLVEAETGLEDGLPEFSLNIFRAVMFELNKLAQQEQVRQAIKQAA